MVNQGGEQFLEDYKQINPQSRVPTLIDGDHVMSQSLAISSYLDDCDPHRPLVFGDAAQKANIQSLALLVACDSHPLNNLSALVYLKKQLSVSEAEKV